MWGGTILCSQRMPPTPPSKKAILGFAFSFIPLFPSKCSMAFESLSKLVSARSVKMR